MFFSQNKIVNPNNFPHSPLLQRRDRGNLGYMFDQDQYQKTFDNDYQLEESPDFRKFMILSKVITSLGLNKQEAKMSPKSKIIFEDDTTTRPSSSMSGVVVMQ